MEIPQHKTDWFVSKNFPVEKMEEVIAAYDDDANKDNAPRKEVAAIMATRKKVEKEEVLPVEEIEKADMPDEEEEDEEDVQKEYVTKEEVADVVVSLVKGHEEALSVLPEILKELKELGERIGDLEKTDEEKLAVKKEEIPAASLQSIIAERLMRDAGQGNLSKHQELEGRKPNEEGLTLEDFRPGGNLNIPFLDNQIKGGRKNA